MYQNYGQVLQGNDSNHPSFLALHNASHAHLYYLSLTRRLSTRLDGNTGEVLVKHGSRGIAAGPVPGIPLILSDAIGSQELAKERRSARSELVLGADIGAGVVHDGRRHLLSGEDGAARSGAGVRVAWNVDADILALLQGALESDMTGRETC